MPSATLAARQKFFVPFDDYKRTQGNDENISPNMILAIHPLGKDYNTTDQGLVIGERFRPFLRECVVEEDEKMTSQVHLTFNDKDYQVSNAIENGQYILGNGAMVDIGLGYGRHLNFFGRRFRLVGSYSDFPSNEIPTFVLKGYDGRHQMIEGDYIGRKPGSETLGTGFRKGRKKTPRIFKNKTDSDTVSELCYYHNFLVDLDPTAKKHTRVKKKGTTDWEFILSLARKNGYVCWVDFGEASNSGDWGTAVPGPQKFAKFRQKGIPQWVLHFRKPPHVMDSGFIFEYGKDLLEFNIREELTGVPSDIEIIHFDRKLRKVDLVTFNPTNVNPQLPEIRQGLIMGSEIRFAFGDRTIWTIYNKPFKDKKAAIEFAKRFLEVRNDDFVVGTGKIIGVENVRPRQIHFLDKIGRHSGEWVFSQVRHRYTSDGVYACEFTCRKRQPLISLTKIRQGSNTINFRQGSVVTPGGVT